ncbi:3-hydroxyacyl-ACP dehydratase FabZ family protein [Lentzea sp. NPDC051213]|uniref:3-hydroxyacyl-ACP dehydratase FabZ family protein n=1 Tax=Lentzea sp. NPDC051213 TaxID=3364126 RepID=UPI0037A4B79E
MTGIVLGEVVATTATTGPSTATVSIGADEPVLAGHFPDFPIFPGVCVVECVHRGARLTAPAEAGRVRLVAMESVRWLAPVFPGDTLTITVDWRGEDPTWWCTGQASTASGVAAVVRLRYQAGAAR